MLFKVAFFLTIMFLWLGFLEVFNSAYFICLPGIVFLYVACVDVCCVFMLRPRGAIAGV